MKKTILLISASVLIGALFNAYQPFIDPPIVTIDNWQQIDGERMILKNECESQKYDIRKENDEKFIESVEAKVGEYKNFPDCDGSPVIYESNCDTIELEDTLEQCVDANALLNTQIYNLMYK